MKSVLKFLSASILLLSTSSLVASPGTSSMSLLTLQPDARSSVFKSSFVAVADDVNASSVNPAGLILQKRVEASLSHAIWVSGMSLESVSFGMNLKRAGSLALSASYLNSTEISFLTYSGENNLSSGSLSAGLSYGLMVVNNLIALGGSGKLVSETIGSTTVMGFSMDAGLLIAPAKGILIGASAKNLGVSGTASSLPLEFVGGISYKYKWKNNPLESFQVALASKFPMESDLVWGGTVETSFRPSKTIGLKLRIGLEYPDVSASGLANMLSFGAGFIYSKIGLDWSMLSLGDLGYTQRLSVSWKL